VDLLTKITLTNELCSALDRIANEKSTESIDFSDQNDIHVLARRVLTLLEEFKQGRSLAALEDTRRSTSGQKQR
jgi:hypothetical protein